MDKEKEQTKECGKKKELGGGGKSHINKVYLILHLNYLTKVLMCLVHS